MRSFLISLFLISGIICLLLPGELLARQVYHSVSGPETTMLSGDIRNQYDYWLKPGTEAGLGQLEVYDASTGGSADVVLWNSKTTRTAFRLYRFSQLYRMQAGKPVALGTDPGEPVTELITLQEPQYRDTWVVLSDMAKTGPEGYILRVSTSSGDDVNNFRLRTMDGWTIYSFDLSASLINSSLQQFYRFSTADRQELAAQPLLISGEEDSKVLIRDRFGKSYAPSSGSLPRSVLDMRNHFSLEISGSKQKINNFSVTGARIPVLWEWPPVEKNLVSRNTSALRFKTENGKSCYEKFISISGGGPGGAANNDIRWYSDGRLLGRGISPSLLFSNWGVRNVQVLIPASDRETYPGEYRVYETEVNINVPPVITLNTPKTIITPGEKIHLIASGSYDHNNKPLTFKWYKNGKPVGTGVQYAYTRQNPGTDTVTVEVSNGGRVPECSISRRELVLRANNQPEVDIIHTELFSPGTDQIFYATGINDADGDSLSLLWESVGIVGSKTGKEVRINHAEAGDFRVRLWVNDRTGTLNSKNMASREYTVNASPMVDIQAPNTVSPRQRFTLDGSDTKDMNNSTLSYRWYLEGKQISTKAVTSHLPEESGIYTFRLVTDDGLNLPNSVSESTHTVRVNAPPVPVIGIPEKIPGATVHFDAGATSDADSDNLQYSWDFGDGYTASTPVITHSYEKPGTYAVTLTVDDLEGLDNSRATVTRDVVINAYPVARFNSPEVVAPGLNFTLDASPSFDPDGSLTDYTWFMDGLETGQGLQLQQTLNTPGVYSYTLRVLDDSESGEGYHTTTKTVTVNTPPVARWSSTPQELVPDTPIRFSALASSDDDQGIARYEWDFGNGKTYTGPEITHRFDEGGEQSFTLKVTDKAGVQNSTTALPVQVYVNTRPTIVTEKVIRSNSQTVVLDASSSFDLDNNPVSFLWTLPDGTQRREAVFSWTAPEPGVHIVSLTVDDMLGLNNSRNEELVRVLINQPVQAVVDSVIRSCTGQTVIFNSSESYDPDEDPFTVSWEFGNGDGSNEANPSYVYDEPGIYEATVSLTDGFTDEVSRTKIPVIIEGSPVARIAFNDTTVCVNTPLELDGTGSSDPSGSQPAFTWSFEDGTTLNGSKPRKVFTETGTYEIMLTVEGSGSSRCPNTHQTTAMVRVIEGPVAEFSLPDGASPGDVIPLDASSSTANGGFSEVNWYIQTPDSVLELQGMTQEFTVQTPGAYSVDVEMLTNAETECNRVTLSRSLQVNAAPVIRWTLPDIVATGADLQLNALQSGDPDGFIQSYTWYLDGEIVGRNAAEIIKVSEPGRHTVRLEIADNSSASNRMVSMEKSFVANSSPRAVIAPLEIPYLNQELTLSTTGQTDADGDQLKTRWRVGGQEKSGQRVTIKLEEMRPYRVVLIQDDGRNLPNSADSAVVDFIPRSIPSLQPIYPPQIVRGGSLDAGTMNLPAGWELENGNRGAQTWTAAKTGTDSLVFVFRINGEKLQYRHFPIEVREPLTITGPQPDIQAEWDPVKPFYVLQSPEVNREPSAVEIIWYRGEDMVGRGSRFTANIQKGENTYRVEIRDRGIAQSEAVSQTITVNAR